MDFLSNPDQSRAFTRRAFLTRGAALASAAATLPMLLERSAWALAQPGDGLSSIPGAPDERVLVVVQLAGGNDGLNTVIPFGMDDYYRARPGIGRHRFVFCYCFDFDFVEQDRVVVDPAPPWT